MRLVLSPIVAGAWRLPDWQWTPQQRLAWIAGNLAIGVTSFDHADTDGSDTVEQLFGEALALQPGLRRQLQLVSTLGLQAPPGGATAAVVQASVDRSLQALHTDHLDLLLLHGPALPADLDTLATACNALQHSGRVLQFGATNCSTAELARLHQRLPLAAHQFALSPLQQAALHDGVLGQCQALGLRPMAWAPLAGGRIFTGQDAVACRLRAVLQPMAADRGISVTTLVIAWLLQHPSAPLPILGSRRIGVATEALAARQLTLDDADWQRIRQAGAATPSGAASGSHPQPP